MNKTNWQRLLAAALVAALLVTGFAPAAMAATAQTAPSAVAQQVSGAKEVTGTLTGGQFAKIWLALTPDSNPGTVTVTADWDRPNADSSNVGFYILNEQNLQRVLGGESLIENNVGQGQSQFFLNGADNVQGARFNATGACLHRRRLQRLSHGCQFHAAHRRRHARRRFRPGARPGCCHA